MMDSREIELLPGQFITGRFTMNDDYNKLLPPRKKVPATTLWRWLKVLEQCGNLDIKATNKYSVITISKWHDYQEDEQQLVNKWSTTGQQMVTNKNVKNDKKKHYAENVLLTEKEYANLCDKYGKELADRSIEFLSLYKVEKAYKTKSDNLTIQRWVVDAVKSTPKHRQTEKKVVQIDFSISEEERQRVADIARKQGLPATFNK
jgi:hypothetical protein